MGVRATSREAYADIAMTLPARQLSVWSLLLYGGPMCNGTIGRRLGWPINTVTPRVHELVARGLVAESHRAPDPVSGRRVIWWQVADVGGVQIRRPGDTPASVALLPPN